MADKRLRTLESWRCADGHEFGYDPEKGPLPTKCPQMVKPWDGGRWPTGCKAKVERVKQAGVLR